MARFKMGGIRVERSGTCLVFRCQCLNCSWSYAGTTLYGAREQARLHLINKYDHEEETHHVLVVQAYLVKEGKEKTCCCTQKEGK